MTVIFVTAGSINLTNAKHNSSVWLELSETEAGITYYAKAS